jgi:hypothetical protein
MQEQLLDLDLDRQRILAKAVESCSKRAKVASELLALNIVLLQEEFMSRSITADVANHMHDAHASITSALKLLGKAK